MRKTSLTLLSILALTLGACDSGTQSPTAPAANASTQIAKGHTITGTVDVLAGNGVAGGVSPDAKLHLQLVDVSQDPSRILAEKNVQPVGTLPRQINLDYDPGTINGHDVIVVVATLVDGERRYSMPLQSAVLTKGKSSTVDIKLVPEPTVAEKVMASFKRAEAQLGTMDLSNGKDLGEHRSRAWQVFKKNGHIQFVREIEDDFKTSARINTDYAYKDGQPWVVVRKHRPSTNAAPTRTERAAWDEAGKLTVQQVEADGKTTELSADDAKAMHAAAVKMFKEAGGQ